MDITLNLHATSTIIAQLVVKVQGFKDLPNIHTHTHAHTTSLSPYIHAVIPITVFSFYSIWQLLSALSTLTTPLVIHVHVTMKHNVMEW